MTKEDSTTPQRKNCNEMQSYVGKPKKYQWTNKKTRLHPNERPKSTLKGKEIALQKPMMECK